jgi:hypothetical protein
MRKFTIAMLALVTVSATVVPANAQYRRYQQRYSPHRHGSWVGPAIVGGLALGIGGALVYDRYRRHCWIESQDVVDRYGRYLGTEDVRVCN